MDAASVCRSTCLLAAGLTAVSMAAILAISGVTSAIGGDEGPVGLDPAGIRQGIGSAEDGAAIFVEGDLSTCDGIEVVPVKPAKELTRPGPAAPLEPPAGETVKGSHARRP